MCTRQGRHTCGVGADMGMQGHRWDSQHTQKVSDRPAIVHQRARPPQGHRKTEMQEMYSDAGVNRGLHVLLSIFP